MAADLLELEHLFGYTGKYQNTLIFHPAARDTIIYGVDALVAVESLSDSHLQYFLRGHDADVSALAITHDGSLLASGQAGSQRAKTPEAPVVLWDLTQRQPLAQFMGLFGQTTCLRFSNDGNFLAAAADNGAFIIWDSKDGSTVYSKRTEQPLLTFAWGPTRDSNQGLPGAGKHPSYSLFQAYFAQAQLNNLDFNIASMTYGMTNTGIQLPSTGLTRRYTCSAVSQNGDYAFTGTQSGEVCVFSLASRIFRASLPISTNGITAMTEVRGDLFVGSGDGRLKKLAGGDKDWRVVAEAQLPGKVVSINSSPDGSELICGTNLGCIFRALTRDLSNVIFAESHVGPCKDIAFGSRSDRFCVIDAAGFVRLWDSGNYSVLFRAGPSTRVAGTACAISEDEKILTGWQDGFMRYYDPATGAVVWEVPNAHRGGITALYIDQNYIISGGEDGIVRLWARQSHQLITQFTDNRRSVTRVFPDVKTPHIIHTCGNDRVINSYDLKLERRIIRHEVGNGSFCDMTQRLDSELELVTCGVGNNILFWDCDEANPVQYIPFRGQLNTLQIGPSGRYMAAGAANGELYVFDLTNLACAAQCVGHSGPITRLRWAPDEKQIVTVSEDCSVAIWNVFLGP